MNIVGDHQQAFMTHERARHFLRRRADIDEQGAIVRDQATGVLADHHLVTRLTENNGNFSFDAQVQLDFDRAQKTFRALLLQKLQPSDGLSKADVYFYLGDISHQQGEASKAISMLERAVAEDASHERAAALLATLKS